MQELNQLFAIKLLISGFLEIFGPNLNFQWGANARFPPLQTPMLLSKCNQSLIRNSLFEIILHF